ncbi:ribosomal protein S18 [Cercophora samala]|uniref:Small ribosomal subunit protein bS18m n=1 Tax=Cercophora samala TaxID=330535 RepID=A0AA40DA45_9PEZI|nr:ribosomal protein S18 [Cercophora samala]
MYLRKHPRVWRDGDVYAPHDLSPAEARKWKGVKSPKKDVIDMLGVNPLDNYRNFSMISEFMTPMGRIMHSKDTGLRPVNQRKMAKAIRRAIGLGIHPSVHRHPEVMKMRRGINTAMKI